MQPANEPRQGQKAFMPRGKGQSDRRSGGRSEGGVLWPPAPERKPGK